MFLFHAYIFREEIKFFQSYSFMIMLHRLAAQAEKLKAKKKAMELGRPTD